LVAIVDAAHTRIYTYQQPDGGDPEFREAQDLVNPGRQGHGRDLFTNTKPGNRWQEGGRGSTDDHRNAHLAELDARFAKSILTELERMAQEQGYNHVILVASPKMLGVLRDGDPFKKRNVVVDEIAQDLAWLTSPQLHDHLASMNLIAPRPRAAFARGARR
jgi:protein required for attachment to host cells